MVYMYVRSSILSFQYCIYVMSTFLCIILSLFKITVLYILKPDYQKIILYAQKNFWHLKYKGNDKILFMKCRKFCKLWAIIACFFMQSSLSFYVITPLSGKWIKLYSTKDTKAVKVLDKWHLIVNTQNTKYFVTDLKSIAITRLLLRLLQSKLSHLRYHIS